VTSWVDGAGGSAYDADNLPYGVFSRDDEEPRVGARIGEYVLDLAPVAATEMLDVHAVFVEPTLNELLRQGRPLVKDDVVALKKLARLLNEPANQQQVVELLDRLPESMTDQTRTGTYGAWYSYYVCGFSGRITLPGNLGDIPGLQQVLKGLGDLNFHSTAPRCNGAGETPYAGSDPGGAGQ